MSDRREERQAGRAAHRPSAGQLERAAPSVKAGTSTRLSGKFYISKQRSSFLMRAASCDNLLSNATL